MFRRLFLILSLALLFGLGQQGAAAHAISHLADEQHQQDKSGHASFCDKCVVYAGLASAMASTVFVLPPTITRHTASCEQTPHASAALQLSYAARAPPVLTA